VLSAHPLPNRGPCFLHTHCQTEGSALDTPTAGRRKCFLHTVFLANPGQIAPGLEPQDLHRDRPDLFFGIVVPVPIPAALVMLSTKPNPNPVWDAPCAVLVAAKNVRHRLLPVDLGLVHIGSHVAHSFHVPEG
jgi:hypothetical protein